MVATFDWEEEMFYLDLSSKLESFSPPGPLRGRLVSPVEAAEAAAEPWSAAEAEAVASTAVACAVASTAVALAVA